MRITESQLRRIIRRAIIESGNSHHSRSKWLHERYPQFDKYTLDSEKRSYYSAVNGAVSQLFDSPPFKEVLGHTTAGRILYKFQTAAQYNDPKWAQNELEEMWNSRSEKLKYYLQEKYSEDVVDSKINEFKEIIMKFKNAMGVRVDTGISGIADVFKTDYFKGLKEVAEKVYEFLTKEGLDKYDDDKFMKLRDKSKSQAMFVDVEGYSGPDAIIYRNKDKPEELMIKVKERGGKPEYFSDGFLRGLNADVKNAFEDLPKDGKKGITISLRSEPYKKFIDADQYDKSNQIFGGGYR